MSVVRPLSPASTAPARREWLSRKIAQLRDEGYPGRQAVAIAYHEATAVYLRRRRTIPADLVRQYREEKARINPRKKARKKAAQKRTTGKAERLYAGFRESAPRGAERWDLPADQVGVKMGLCVGVIYTTTIHGGNEKFIHTFRRDAAPVLAVGEDGTQLYLLGGKYRVTERGIVDHRRK